MATEVSQKISVEHASHTRYWVIVFAVTLAVVTYIDRVCISFAAPSIRKDLNLDTVQMGWAFTAFGVAYALFEIPGGYLGDWLGPRRVLMRIVTWWSFFTAATGWAWSLGSLITTRFLFGAGEAGCFPNLTKAFTTWLPPRERVRAQGIMWLSARWGGAFTPPLVAAVMAVVGWRHAFEIFGCLGVIWAVSFYFWYRDDPLTHPALNAGERELLRESSKMASGHGHVPWGLFFSSRQVWMLCWQYFCLSYGWYFFVTWLPTYLQEGRHLAVSSSAWLGVLPLFMGGIGNPVSVFIGGLILPRLGSLGRMRQVMGCVGFLGAAFFLVSSTRMTDPVLAMVAIGLASFCNDLAMPPSWGAAMDIGGKHAGTLSGAMNMWGNVGGALSPLAIGYMLKWTDNNWNLTFYVSAAIYLMGIVCWMLLDPVTPLEKEEEA
jgi:MFS family permease